MMLRSVSSSLVKIEYLCGSQRKLLEYRRANGLTSLLKYLSSFLGIRMEAKNREAKYNYFSLVVCSDR